VFLILWLSTSIGKLGDITRFNQGPHLHNQEGSCIKLLHPPSQCQGRFQEESGLKFLQDPQPREQIYAYTYPRILNANQHQEYPLHPRMEATHILAIFQVSVLV